MTPPCTRRRPVGPLGHRADAVARADGTADGVCVLLGYYSPLPRPAGAALPADCKANQVLVSLAPSGLFDEHALAQALSHAAHGRGRSTAWSRARSTSVVRCTGSKAAGHARVASTTRESRIRSAWAVARRMDEILRARPDRGPTSRRRRQARSLVSKTTQRLREVVQARTLLEPPRAGARDEARCPAWRWP